MASFLTRLLGDPNAKVLKALRVDADKVNAFESAVASLDDSALKAKTDAFRERLKNGESIDDVAHEAFAVVREAAKRTLGQRHYDVQIMGGFVLHRGGIAEMRTGEGKTLTATLAMYVNALSGEGVHVVTVNDYLAKRDAVWMGRVFAALGISVGCIQHESGYVFDASFTAVKPEATEDGVVPVDTTEAFRVEMDFLRPVDRKSAYAADITYGTNNEFGFDYLRDNMAPSVEHMAQRGLHYAIVDEVDSILIDEARTPLIISAPAEESADLYYQFAGIVKDLAENVDYNIDEKMRVSTFTEEGLQNIEKKLGIPNLYEGGLALVHHAEQALRAHALYKIDRDYVVRGDEVLIVDEFTGRIMEGRRYSEGLHQAIEAKEGVKIQRESKTLATITFQNYFRMYEKLSGMTGTAATEAEEFSKIYKLDVTQIPTNNPARRDDLPDRIYKNEQGKWLSVVEEVKRRHELGQPMLVGTISIEKNERLGELLRLAGIPHKMLNAKNHESEAEIIAQAGRKGAVTLATNMAGRGVDIILGGNPVSKEDAEAVKALGGLHVIGTERHESRRIDNQLRGRAGRQGDPGSTQFFASLDDDLMRIFGSDRVKNMMTTLGIDDTTPIESAMVTRAIEKAQQRVEGHNFDTRKHVLEYDDVLNKHRTALYADRRALLDDEPEKAHDVIMKMIEDEVERIVLFHTTKAVDIPEEFARDGDGKDWDPKEIIESLATIVPFEAGERAAIMATLAELSRDREVLAGQRTDVIELAMRMVRNRFTAVSTEIGDAHLVALLERNVLLRSTDAMWMRHLDDMTYLRRTIGLQGYAQRDPLVEYKKESFRLYGEMRADIARDVTYNLLKMLDQAASARTLMMAAPPVIKNAINALTGENGSSSRAVAATSNVNDHKDLGRNDPCFCGSGKKFKKCHGA